MERTGNRSSAVTIYWQTRNREAIKAIVDRFNLPPHLKTLGETSWMAKKYGKLPKDWQSLIHDGFTECMRFMKLPNNS